MKKQESQLNYYYLKIMDMVIIIFTIVLIINSLFNFFQKSAYKNLDISLFFKLISTLLLFNFLIQIGKVIKKIFNFNNLSISIIVFLISYFTIDNILLIFTKNINFHTFYNIISIFWIAYALIKKVESKIILYLFLSYFSLVFFNNKFYLKLINQVSSQSTDVAEFWMPSMLNILNNNYYYSLENNFVEGYGLLISYIHALINIISMGRTIEGFNQISPNLYIFVCLFILFISELELTQKTKSIVSLTALSILLNSTWLRFLFIESLMGEAVISIVFVILIYEIFSSFNFYKDNAPILYVIFGSLFLGKQFIILISLFILLIEFLVNKNIKIVIFSPLVFLFYSTYSKYFFGSGYKISYLNGNTIFDIFKLYILENNLSLVNISKIIDIFLLDKIFIIFIFVFILSYLGNLKTNKFLFNNYLNFSIFTNTILIFLLYISYWQNIELESAYRYFLNLIYVIFLKYALNIEKIFVKK